MRLQQFFIAGLLLVTTIALAISIPLSLRKTNAEIVDELLTEEPVFDGHNDWPWSLRSVFNNSINDVDLDSDLTVRYSGHTDIPRLKKGKVGAQFWSCYVPCSSQGKDAVRQGLQQIDVIKRMVANNPDDLVFTSTVDEIEAAQKEGKIASTIGVEGGHMIDSSLGTLRLLYELGARYITLTHSCDIPWATAFNTNKPSEGLTDFGKKVVLEMNRLGMLIDLAHVSDQTMIDVFNITRSPVIYSHSSARAICSHMRNVPDDILLLLKQNKGVIMINFYNDYINCDSNATLSQVADHYDYIKEFIGVNYLGIGGDYDGVSRLPTGLEDVSKYPDLMVELLNRGWTTDEIKKICGENIKRVLRENEVIAKNLQKSEKPAEDWIDSKLVESDCRTG